MERRRSDTAPKGATRRATREDLRALLRRPWVLALLGLTAAVPPIAMANAPRDEAPVLVLEPQKAMPFLGEWVLDGENHSVEQLWRMHAVARESERLTAGYLQRGYRISPELARDIGRAAMDHDIAIDVAFGLVRAESGFRNAATSPVGATGLTQLMPRTAAWMQPGVTVRELRNPETNLNIGFKYLRYLIDRYDGDTRLALLAYNRGPGTVDRALRRGANPDNGYADFVMGKANHGHRLFTNAGSTRSVVRPAPKRAPAAPKRKSTATRRR